jgi:hypothetical protein
MNKITKCPKIIGVPDESQTKHLSNISLVGGCTVAYPNRDINLYGPQNVRCQSQVLLNVSPPPPPPRYIVTWRLRASCKVILTSDFDNE